jgi:hypothetical protein
VSGNKHRWLFLAEDSELGEVYLDTDGKTVHAEEFYVGTDAEADRESQRRADLWESDPTHGMVLKVTREGHGVVE